MNLRLIRQPNGPNATFGILFLDGFFECFTLENTLKMIPAGTYDLDFYHSPHFNRTVPLLKNVQNRSFIEIHPANYYTDLEGCIGVGEEMNGTQLEDSLISFGILMTKLSGQKDVKIKIEEWA